MAGAEAERDAVEHALSVALSAEMVTRWVCIVETIGADGERGTYVLGQRDMQLPDTLGLIDYARALEYADVIRDTMHSDD